MVRLRSLISFGLVVVGKVFSDGERRRSIGGKARYLNSSPVLWAIHPQLIDRQKSK